MNSTERELLLLLVEKSDQINDKIGKLEVTSAKQEVNLQEHMKRSDLLEDQVDFLNKEVKPILQGVSFLKGFAKFALWCAGILKALALFFR
jgi:hypothetical protein